MIKLDNNYSIKPDSTHGFRLIFESEPFEKMVHSKDGMIKKMVTSKETWYYPSLSMTLKKYFSLNLKNIHSKEELLDRVVNLEKSINKVLSVYAKEGKVFKQ